MKKRITNIILTVALLITLSVNVMAVNTVTNDKDLNVTETWSIEFNDNYTQIYINDEAYQSVRIGRFTYNQDNYYIVPDGNIIVSGENANTMLNVHISVCVEGALLNVDFELTNGQFHSYYFLNEKYMDELANIIQYGGKDTLINFQYPEDNFVNTPYDKLIENEAIELTQKSDEVLRSFYVYSYFTDVDIGVQHGEIYIDSDNNVYYNNDAENREYMNTHGTDVMYVHPITDTKLKEEILNAYNEYNEDFAIFDTDMPETIAKGLFTFLFAIIPGFLIIVSIGLSVRLPKKYRKALLTLCVLSIIEIIIFIALAVLLF